MQRQQSQCNESLPNEINSSVIQSDILFAQKRLTIPLMSKKQNPIQKYMKGYQLPFTKQQSNPKKQKSMLSDCGSRLAYGGKITPDNNYTKLDENKYYVKFSSMQEYQSGDKLNALDNIGSQYYRLKNGISQRQPYLSKHSLPNKNILHSRSGISSISIPKKRPELKPQQLQKQLKKSIVLQKGKRYFADLYMLQKQRLKIKQQIQNGQYSSQKHPSHNVQQQIQQSQHLNTYRTNKINRNYNTQQQFIIDKKQKQMKQKKIKLMKNKGLNWNVYYQALALNKTEKKNLRNNNNKFVMDYGTQ